MPHASSTSDVVKCGAVRCSVGRSLPEACWRDVVARLAESVNELYWPIDVVDQAAVMAESVGLDLVSVAHAHLIPARNGHGLDHCMWFTRHNLDVNEAASRYGLPTCALTPYVFKKKNRNRGKKKKKDRLLVSDSDARMLARERFGTVEAWRVHMMCRANRLTLEGMHPVGAAVLWRLAVQAHPVPMFVSCEEAARIVRLLSHLPPPEDCAASHDHPEHTDWIIANHLKRRIVSVEHVVFYVGALKIRAALIREELKPLVIGDLDAFLSGAREDEQLGAWTRCERLAECVPFIGGLEAAVQRFVCAGGGTLAEIMDEARARWRDRLITSRVHAEHHDTLLAALSPSTPCMIAKLERFSGAGMRAELEHEGEGEGEGEGGIVYIVDLVHADGSRFSDIPIDWYDRRHGYSDCWLVNCELEHANDGAMVEILDAYAGLRAALSARGLSVREDSRTCEAYVMDGDGELEDVVAVMDEMRFFFGCTKYESFKDALQWAGVGLSGVELSEQAKLAALHEYAGDVAAIPPAWRSFSAEDAKMARELVQKGRLGSRDRYMNESDVCDKCGAWKDDPDYCSMCGTDSESD